MGIVPFTASPKHDHIGLRGPVERGRDDFLRGAPKKRVFCELVDQDEYEKAYDQEQADFIGRPLVFVRGV